LAEETVSIQEANLDHRFSIADAPDELKPVVDRLNDLLQRLESAFERERRFTGNVAHELRTPIAELRTLAEVGLRTTRTNLGDGEAEHRYLDDALDIAIQMESIVSVLLDLARHERPADKAKMENLELIGLILEQLRVLGLSDQVDVGSLPADAWVWSNPALLDAIVRNILMNAAVYTISTSHISVAVETRGDTCILEVSNPADLDPAMQDRVFEPFWRRDAARSDRDHVGLGLTIVKAFATASGIDVDASVDAAGLFRLRLVIPARGQHAVRPEAGYSASTDACPASTE